MKTQLLQQMIDEKYISKRKHPTADLFIYNYTAKAQYDWLWNEATMRCRGLIMDAADTVIARPFQKFFNLTDEMELPLIPFEVTDKLDGSLGILYWIGGEAFIATRGSFESDQAVKAKEILDAKYADAVKSLDRSKTYLFEILYAGNKIVVDYGAREDLVLLAIIDTATGNDLPLTDIGFPVVERFTNVADVRKLAERQEANAEGFVVRFENGFRVKVKFDEYKRLHRLVTQVSNVVIWEYLSEGKPFDELLDRVPDEFYDWLSNTKKSIQDAYDAVERDCKAVFKELETRKDTALYFQTQKHPHVLFAMLDKKDHAPIIWKMVRPVWTQPFKTDEV